MEGFPKNRLNILKAKRTSSRHTRQENLFSITLNNMSDDETLRFRETELALARKEKQSLESAAGENLKSDEKNEKANDEKNEKDEEKKRPNFKKRALELKNERDILLRKVYF